MRKKGAKSSLRNIRDLPKNLGRLGLRLWDFVQHDVDSLSTHYRSLMGLEPIRITLTPVGSLALKIPRSAAPSLPPLAKGADRRGAAGEGIFALGHSLTGLFG